MEPLTAGNGQATAVRDGVAIPKLRSRKHGAAIPLSEQDKQLLNLLQSRFPLAREPFNEIARFANAPVEWVLERTQELLEDRIIRELTPIFDTRALGYESMLVAASVDPENPHRAAKIVNAHPGVSHNYLRNHEFNLWFTLATPPDSKLGMAGTLDVIARESGATSVRQLPTLKLFKINMNLEMEKGTEILAAPGGDSVERPLDRLEISDLDLAVIKNLQGQLPVVPEPYGPAAEALGITVDRLLTHCQNMVERGLLRRVAAILFHRRAGFSANGMGVWKVPEERIATIGPQMAEFRGISHCYQRPTYEDWPYSVFTMAHGRSKTECDEILASIAQATGIADYATLYSSTEFKKTRLLYFTDEYADWEAQWI